jgi:5-(hydroxymethyl)furfural/furfural oxidase
VADASVIPRIPSANTNLTTIAVAERIAGWLAGTEPADHAATE